MPTDWDKERSNHLFQKGKIAYLTFTGVCGCQCGWAGCILGWYCGCKWKDWNWLMISYKNSLLTLTFYFPGAMRNMFPVSPRNPTVSDFLPCHLAYTRDLLVMSFVIKTHSWENAKKIGFLFERQPGTSSASHKKAHQKNVSFNQRWRVRKVTTIIAVFRRSPIFGDSISL